MENQVQVKFITQTKCDMPEGLGWEWVNTKYLKSPNHGPVRAPILGSDGPFNFVQFVEV